MIFDTTSDTSDLWSAFPQIPLQMSCVWHGSYHKCQCFFKTEPEGHSSCFKLYLHQWNFQKPLFKPSPLNPLFSSSSLQRNHCLGGMFNFELRPDYEYGCKELQLPELVAVKY